MIGSRTEASSPPAVLLNSNAPCRGSLQGNVGDACADTVAVVRGLLCTCVEQHYP